MLTNRTTESAKSATRSVHRLPFAIGLLIFAGGLVLSLCLYRLQVNRNATTLERLTLEQTQRVATELPLRIQGYEKGVRGTRGAILVGGQEHTSLETFLIYTHSRDIDIEFPGANGFGFIRRVPAASEAAFLQEARRSIDAHFAIRQFRTHPDERFVVDLIEPSGSNLSISGFDIASDPRTRNAALGAIRSGHAALTAPIEDTRLPPTADRNLLLLLPVYRPGMPTKSVEERTAATIGWAFATLHASEVLQRLNVIDYLEYHLEISDVTDDPATTAFFDSEKPRIEQPSLPIQELNVPLYGRQWHITVQPTSRLLASLHLVTPRFVLWMGLVVSLLASALGTALTLIARRRIDLQQARRAQFRSAELAEANATLEQKSREAEASERKFRLMVESVEDYAIFMLDPNGLVAGWNSGAQRIKGYQEHEIVGQHFSKFYTPEDLAAGKPAWELEVASAEGRVEDEGWRIKKDGTLFFANVCITAQRSDADELLGFTKVTRDITAHKQAEAALRESEQRLRTITDNIPGLISHLDRDLRYRFVNQAYATWFNVEPASLIGTRVKDFYGETVFAGIETALRSALDGNTVTDEREISSNGILRHCHVVLLPEKDGNGEVVGLFAIHTDITERRRAEMALRASESFLARTGAVAGVGGWEMDLLENTVTWSAETKRLHEVADDYVPTLERALEFYAPASKSLVNDCFKKCIADGTAYDVELELVSARGRRFWARATGMAEFTDGKAVRALGAFQDITERRRDSQRLREMSSLLTSVLDSASEVAIISTDADLNITVFNAGAERLLGFTGEELIGHATPALFHDMDEVHLRAKVLQERFGRSFEGTAVFTDPASLRQPHEWTFIRKDGERVEVSLVITAMSAEDGKIFGYVGVAYDITTRAQYERSMHLAMDQAETANKAKSEFLANMSHEIRTPLNAVIGLGYLLEHTSLSEDQRQFVAKIQFAGRSLLSVVNNVLDLSKIEAGEMLLEEETFELPELLKDVGHMLLAQAAAKGVELVVEIPLSLPRRVEGDMARLRQILTNLVNNSIKFTESGSVTLEVWCTEQEATRMRLRCDVRDTGIGIEPAVLERLFTPFTQADASTTRRFGGTGLGLSIARRFVELMGGEIGVASTLGVGSTFWFEIPLTVIADGGTHMSTESNADFRILIADPVGDDKQSLSAMVRAIGWVPEITSNEEQLRHALMTQPGAPVDVLIVDLALRADGTNHLLEDIRASFGAHEPPPIILIAADTQVYMQYESSIRAEHTLLLRPLSSSGLFNAINAAVWKQTGGREQLLQATNWDELHAQWLVGVRILVVDDSDINLEVARRILEKQGALVATCSDGRMAVDYVRQNTLDVILMDIQMPVLDGNEATQLIRSELQLRDLPIIALTAGALLGERHRSLASGMNDFISKPFEPLTLIRKVRYMVEQSRGEPIEMVLVDRPAEVSSKSPLMASIDAGVVQQMFGEDLSLFRSVLSRMLRDYADLALPTCIPFDDEDSRAVVMARVHKLKGGAGMLGATRVMQLAGAAETALRKERPTEVIDRILRQLACALTTLREEAEPFINQLPPTDSASTAADHRPVDLQELLELLESQNLAAVDKASQYAPSLAKVLGMASFEHLREAIDNLDFVRAATLLRETQTGEARKLSNIA